jgi:Mn-containing catalase
MEAGLIWNGKHPEDGSELTVIQGAKAGVPYPVLEEEPQLNSPGEDNFDPEMFADIAKKLGLEKELKAYR